MSSKVELLRKLMKLVIEDLRRITPSSPEPETLVPFMTKVVWTLAFFMFAYVTAGVLVGA